MTVTANGNDARRDDSASGKVCAPRKPVRKPWWQKLLLVVLPVSVLCVAFEVSARVIDPDQTADGNRRKADLFSRTFYVPDSELIVRLRSNLRTNFQLIRPDADVEVATNSQGFRGAEFAPADPDALRVLVLGDSVTFGLHLPEDQSWPALMRQQLAEQARGRPMQIRNLSVPGYSTFQGRILFARHVVQGDFEPHVVVFAFGFNDSYISDHDDLSMQRLYRQQYDTLLGKVGSAMRKSRFLSLLLEPARGELNQLRVPPQQFRENLEAVTTTAAEIGVEMMLVNTCLPSKYPRQIMADVASQRGIPFVDCRSLFAEQKKIASAASWQLDHSVRIEVPLPGVPIPPSPDDRPAAYMLLVPDATRRLDYRVVAMQDDGQRGDLVAGDGTWSCLVSLPVGCRPEFAFGAPGLAPSWPQMRSNAGILNGFHFLDLQQPTKPTGSDVATVRIARVLTAPWPDLVLMPDPIHPNAKGSRLVAIAVGEQVRASAAWQRWWK
tara:strand:+ start:11894 stop:13378 length:1485 start_codon:yes stop_codon:yes gene_type:complete